MNDRAFEDRFQIGTITELSKAVQKGDVHIAESLCRKYVARHRTDLHAWRLLINSVERNGNSREAVRLAESLLSELPQSVDAVSYAGSVMAVHGATDRAYAALGSKAEKLQTPALVTLGQLSLKRDLANAAKIFRRILNRDGTLEARLGLASARFLAAGSGAPVAFVLMLDWHRSIQQPIQDACEALGVPSFMTLFPWLLRDLQAPLAVVSDTTGHAVIRSQMPGIRIVHTRHGLGDKNYGLAAAAAADFVCVSSQGIADEFVRNGLFEPSRFWVTGYAQLDGMFRKLRSGERRAEPRTVLFAPTFTKGLSAGFALGPNAIDLIRGDDTSIRVIVRPHPNMRRMAPELLNQWRTQAQTMKNVEFNDDAEADIGELLLRSAVLVTDVSSVALIYLALDRPIVCVDIRREAKGSPYFAPEAIEWRMTEAAERAEPAGLAAAVRRALDDPGQMSARREALRRYLFGDLTDGHAGERIAKHIAEAVRHG